jgi:hypothetical protein
MCFIGKAIGFKIKHFLCVLLGKAIGVKNEEHTHVSVQPFITFSFSHFH